MLERLSASVDGARQKTAKSVGDRLHVFGGRKQVPFHIVISELRAELMSTKQHAPGHPCVLLWVRGDTVHITEDSLGQTVLSWSDTYFAQVVPLQVTGSGAFRPKESKFKVQQRGKTIAKTAIVDLSKYCSEIGTARDQSVSVPLLPSGTLYFVISTAPAADQQAGTAASDALSSQSFTTNLRRGSHNPSIVGGGGSSGAGFSAVVGAVAGVSDRPSPSPSNEGSKHNQGGQGHGASPYASVAAKYGNAMVGAAASAASSLTAAVTASGLGGTGRTVSTPEAFGAFAAASSPSDAGDRASTSTSGRPQPSKASASTAGWATGLAAAAAAATTRSTPSTPQGGSADCGGDSEDRPSFGGGMFRRKARGGISNKPTTAFAAAAGAAAASAAAAATPAGASVSKQESTLRLQLSTRKSESANIGATVSGMTDAQSAWDPQAERSLSHAGIRCNGTAVRGSDSGLAAKNAAHRAIRSFTSSPLARGPGGETLPMQHQLPQFALIRSLSRRSNAPSTSSDNGPSGLKSNGAAVEGGGVGGGGGFGSWLRSGLGFGRSSNQSATALEAAAAPLPANGAAAAAGGGAGSGEQPESSSALEADIRSTTEVVELRELALDLLHERDEWRARALSAHDSLGRAQTARGSAVREMQRLEVRLRQYQDELGRRTDGSLLQELVEAKVRIAELANENMKLRRQITHMGPLFYDDSGDDLTPDPRC